MLAIVSAQFVPWAGASTKPVFQVEAEIRRQSETNIILDMTVKNVASKDVSIPDGYLPWDRYAMTLVLVETDPSSTPLKQQLEIADPMPAKPRKLKTGESMRGSIDLTDRFPQLSKVLQRAEVIVFWSYQLQGETGKKFERIGGWKLIPKLPSPARR